MRYHLDTDFLVYAVSSRGIERRRLLELSEGDAEVHMSALAWYEFARGPRTPEMLAIGRGFLGEDGILPFGEDMADAAAEVFAQLGRPRRRAADIVIGVTASVAGATLLTRNGQDFDGIPSLIIESSSSDDEEQPQLDS